MRCVRIDFFYIKRAVVYKRKSLSSLYVCVSVNRVGVCVCMSEPSKKKRKLTRLDPNDDQDDGSKSFLQPAAETKTDKISSNTPKPKLAPAKPSAADLLEAKASAQAQLGRAAATAAAKKKAKDLAKLRGQLRKNVPSFESVIANTVLRKFQLDDEHLQHGPVRPVTAAELKAVVLRMATRKIRLDSAELLLSIKKLVNQ